MSVIKVKRRQQPYAQIDRGILQDKNLSFKARGIAAYLFSKCGDWEVRLQDLVNNSTDGIKAIRSGMKELEKQGYAKLIPVFGENKQLLGKTWEVHEDKITDIPILATSPKSERRKTGTTTKELSKDSSKRSASVSFDDFWIAYDFKKGRAVCEKKWAKLSDKDKEAIMNTLAAYVAETCVTESPKNWKPRRKHPATYLNQRVWEDYIARADEKKDTTELTDDQKAAYEKYLSWVKETHPAAIQAVKYLSAKQFKQYREYEAHMSEQMKYRLLLAAHRRWETMPEQEVYELFDAKMVEHKNEIA